MRPVFPTFILAVVLLNAGAQQASFSVAQSPLLQHPKLFANLGESFPTPDAMAIDKNGRLFLSVPNFANYAAHGSKICVLNEKDQFVTWFDSLPKHPLTGRVHPMGLDFGPDGHLYIADAQSSPDGKNISRLLRVRVENGQPQGVEVVAQGFYSANGVKWNKNRIYITDSYLYVDGLKDQSGIYSLSLEELNHGPVQLQGGGKDPHLLCRFTSRVFNDKHEQGGADGLAFDADNNLYTGNFSDGVISKLQLDANGKLLSQTIVLDSDLFRCCDGMFYDKNTNCIYIANFLNNSIHRLDLKRQTLELLWENDDATGEDGQLDQPCEPILYRGKLVVVNFDSFPSAKNKAVDKFHTVSVFDLPR